MKRLEIIELSRPYRFLSPFGHDGFVALIVAGDPSITDEEQASLSESLVKQGCRWAVCAGNGASTWDDSIDFAYIQADKNLQPQNAAYVMTTWHDEQEPKEIARFFVNDTSFDDFNAGNMLLLFIGCEAETKRKFSQAVHHELRSGG